MNTCVFCNQPLLNDLAPSKLGEKGCKGILKAAEVRGDKIHV